MRKKYEVAVQARNLAVSLKKQRREFTDRERLQYRDIFLEAKEYIIKDARFLSSFMKVNNGFNCAKVLGYIEELNKQENTTLKFSEAKNFEYIIDIDFSIINDIVNMKEGFEKDYFIANYSEPKKLEKQLNILIQAVSVLNKAIAIF